MYAGDLDEAAQLARQAGQIPDIPGTAARLCGFLLAGVLAEAGDLAVAGQACAAALAGARDAGDVYTLVMLLPMMADLDLRAGRTGEAAACLHEAAQIALQTGLWFMIMNVLEAAGTCAPPPGALPTPSRRGPPRKPSCSKARFALTRTRPVGEDALREARRLLGPDRARAAEERGKAMSLATAAEYAQMLTALGSAPLAGPALRGTLSARERELVTLVAQGRTDAQIAAELYISIRTVSSHLDRIRDKTGCRRRADLTRLALTAGLV